MSRFIDLRTDEQRVANGYAEVVDYLRDTLDFLQPAATLLAGLEGGDADATRLAALGQEIKAIGARCHERGGESASERHGF